MDAWDRNRISYIALLQTLEWMDAWLYLDVTARPGSKERPEVNPFSEYHILQFDS
jgi:hypothetical protein